MSTEPTSTDDAVTRAWREVLGAEASADPAAEFFGEGGDSLQAVELVSRLEEECGIEVDFDVLFVDGTLGALQAAVRRNAQG